MNPKMFAPKTFSQLNPLIFSMLLSLLMACGGPVTPNADGPKVVGAASLSNTSLEVSFSKAVGPEASIAANYTITPALAVSNAVLSGDKTKATLSTGIQNNVQYTLAVANVKDLAGNPIDPATKNATFAGTSGTITPGDSDGDGLTNADEVAGWDVKVKKGDGTFDTRKVNSDPALADTDTDGLSDKDERSNFTDPRSADTDQDGLTDFDELKKWGSSPTDVDSDSDAKGNSALFDGNELKDHGTSPTLADTDGDKISDFDEIVVRGGAYNPLIANVPQIELSLEGTTDLSVNIKQTSNNTVIATKSAALTQGSTTSTSSTDTQSRRVEASVSATVGAEVEAGTEGVSTTVSASVTLSAGFSNENTRSYTSGSTQSSQQTSEEALSEGSQSGRAIDDGRVGVGFKVKNAGDVSFKLEDLKITALFRDPSNPTQFKTITTLTPAIPAGGITLASNNQTGVLDARNISIPANQALELMAHPGNLFFQFATYNLTDDEGRNFEFLKEKTLAQTALLVIDYGNGNVKRVRVATNVERQNGTIVGATMKKVLSDILKLAFTTEAKSGGAKVLTSLQDKQAGQNIARNAAEHSLWAVIGSSNLSIPAGTNFEDILLKPGTELHLLYVQDRDEDKLFASEEYFHSTADDKPDFDSDGLKDGEEVKEGWTVAVIGKSPRKVFSNPSAADFDQDALSDSQEKAKGSDPFKADTDGDSTRDDKDPAPLDASLTGNRPPIINSFSATISGFVATVTANVSDPDANLSKVEINWGDGTANTVLNSGFAAINQSHTYASAGPRTITLTATDASNVSVNQSGNVQALIPTAGLLGEYLFNGNTTDTSGNNKNASINQSGCVIAAANRKDTNGLAYMLNNTPNNNCGDNASVYGLIQIPNLGFSQNFSYSIWINPTTNNDQWILGQTNGNGTEAWAGLYIGTNIFSAQGQGGKVSFTLSGTGTTLTVTDTQAVASNTWMHFVVTVASNAGTTAVKLYRNGTEVHAVNGTGSYTNPSGTNPLSIGNASLSNANSVYKGRVDNTRIYNRALTVGEIQALFNDPNN